MLVLKNWKSNNAHDDFQTPWKKHAHKSRVLFSCDKLLRDILSLGNLPQSSTPWAAFYLVVCANGIKLWVVSKDSPSWFPQSCSVASNWGKENQRQYHKGQNSQVSMYTKKTDSGRVKLPGSGGGSVAKSWQHHGL